MGIIKKQCAPVVLALALGVSGAALAPQTAAAEAAEPQAKASKRVVTKAEFRRVKKGMSITKVHKIFDTKGKQSYYLDGYPALDIPAEQQREYKTPSRYGYVSVNYVRVRGGWKADSKTAFWGF